jgi:hypothetical protein
MTFKPPAGFNPLTASPDDVIKNGFPARPDDPRHLARYQRVLGQLNGKLNDIEPTFRVNPDRRHGPRMHRPEDGTETSTNWSGGVVYAPLGQSFNGLRAIGPCRTSMRPPKNQWYYCSSWVGIDGDQSSDVCQAGVECEVFQSGSTITRHIYPWWEWFPGPEVQITNLAINPGDMVTMLICSMTGANATTATAYFSNRTGGASTSFNFTAPSGTKLVGNCAEWIVEAPTVNGAQSAIADYGEVFFSVCEAFLTNGTTVNGGTGNNINLTANGSVVSDGNLFSPTVIQCLYNGAAPMA